MENWVSNLTEMATNVGGKILLALVVFIVGSFIIKKLLHVLKKSKALDKLDASVKSFALSFIKILLYVVLVVSTNWLDTEDCLERTILAWWHSQRMRPAVCRCRR